MAVRLDKAVQHLLGVFVDLAQLRFEALAVVQQSLRTIVPQNAERVGSDHQHGTARTQIAQERFKVAFKLLAPDGLATRSAALRLAQIIGVVGTAAFAPATRQRIVAVGTGNEPAQWKILIDVFPRGYVCAFAHPPLRCLIGFEADDRFMLRGLEMNAPFRLVDQARVVRTVEQFDDALDGHVIGARPLRMLRKEATDFGEGLQTTRGVALKGIGDDRGNRLDPHHKFAVARDTLEAIADRRREYPIARRHT